MRPEIQTGGPLTPGLVFKEGFASNLDQFGQADKERETQNPLRGGVSFFSAVSHVTGTSAVRFFESARDSPCSFFFSFLSASRGPRQQRCSCLSCVAALFLVCELISLLFSTQFFFFHLDAVIFVSFHNYTNPIHILCIMFGLSWDRRILHAGEGCHVRTVPAVLGVGRTVSPYTFGIGHPDRVAEVAKPLRPEAQAA